MSILFLTNHGSLNEFAFILFSLIGSINGFFGDLIHSFGKESNTFLGHAKFWTWQVILLSNLVYKIATLLSCSIVPDLYQQPFISHGWDENMVGYSGINLTTSIEIECSHVHQKKNVPTQYFFKLHLHDCIDTW
jgi:hypothetical protein